MRYAKGAIPTAECRTRMQKTMQSDAAVFRTQVRDLLVREACQKEKIQVTPLC